MIRKILIFLILGLILGFSANRIFRKNKEEKLFIKDDKCALKILKINEKINNLSRTLNEKLAIYEGERKKLVESKETVSISNEKEELIQEDAERKNLEQIISDLNNFISKIDFKDKLKKETSNDVLEQRKREKEYLSILNDILKATNISQDAVDVDKVKKLIYFLPSFWVKFLETRFADDTAFLNALKDRKIDQSFDTLLKADYEDYQRSFLDIKIDILEKSKFNLTIDKQEELVKLLLPGNQGNVLPEFFKEYMGYFPENAFYLRVNFKNAVEFVKMSTNMIGNDLGLTDSQKVEVEKLIDVLVKKHEDIWTKYIDYFSSSNSDRRYSRNYFHLDESGISVETREIIDKYIRFLNMKKEILNLLKIIKNALLDPNILNDEQKEKLKKRGLEWLLYTV